MTISWADAKPAVARGSQFNSLDPKETETVRRYINMIDLNGLNCPRFRHAVAGIIQYYQTFDYVSPKQIDVLERAAFSGHRIWL